MTNLDTITVSVDSSFKFGYGACAYYIKHEKFVVKDTEFIGPINSSTDCELEGLIRAINRMKLEIRGRQIKRVYLTCDCKYALSKILEYKELLSQFQEVIPQHIDGHSGDYSPRQHINNWCDKESRNCLNLNLQTYGRI